MQTLLFAVFATAAVLVASIFVFRAVRRLRAERAEALADRLAAKRYREIFDSSLAGVATTTPDGRILLCNDAFARTFGFESAAAVLAHPAGIRSFYWDEEERTRLLRDVMETGRLKNHEVRMRRKDGTAVWILANLAYARGDGEPRYETTLVDVTERKGLQEQLWQAQKMDALGNLAGGVAHDFNNLLTAIMGSAELLKMDSPPDDPRATELEEIDQACRRAAALTRQLLAFSRRQPFEPRALRLGDCVREMEKMLVRVLGPRAELTCHTSGDLGAIWADKTQVEQVVLNLAVNARDAMPDGGKLMIETGNTMLVEPMRTGQVEVPAGSYIVLSVTDTGTGMDRATLGRIFEPFFTTKEKGRGTGLGLATVYGIIQQSHGFIHVDSTPGQGTTFRCYFPVSEEEVGAAVPTLGAARVEGKETVLVVEDEPAILALARTALTRQGYQVLAAPDGETAMRLAAGHEGTIHLVLSDGMLSGVRVPELLRRLRADRPRTRILLMSGYSQEAIFHNEPVEAAAFIPKPFTMKQLVGRVREVLDQTA